MRTMMTGRVGNGAPLICIGGRALVLLCLLLSLAASAGPDVDRLMEWLGVSSAIRQVDRIIEQSLTSVAPLTPEAGQQRGHQQQSSRQLLALTGTAAVQANMTAYLSQNLPAASARAEALLAGPIASRARNFDVAMEMEGSFAKFQAFLQQLEKTPAGEQRVALLQRLDQARRTSAIAALLQTELEVTSRLVTSRVGADGVPELLASQQNSRQAQRQQHMAAVVLQLNLFSFRYMQNRELQAYVELMEHSSVQSLLDVCMHGLRQSLQAGRAMAIR